VALLHVKSLRAPHFHSHSRLISLAEIMFSLIAAALALFSVLCAQSLARPVVWAPDNADRLDWASLLR
jgi:hypothetical protein